MSNNMEINEVIKSNIKAAGWTFEELAAEMTDKNGKKGITRGAISHLLNGNPTINKLQEIANIIDIPLPLLLYDDGDIGYRIELYAKCPYCNKENSYLIEQEKIKYKNL